MTSLDKKVKVVDCFAPMVSLSFSTVTIYVYIIHMTQGYIYQYDMGLFQMTSLDKKEKVGVCILALIVFPICS